MVKSTKSKASESSSVSVSVSVPAVVPAVVEAKTSKAKAVTATPPAVASASAPAPVVVAETKTKAPRKKAVKADKVENVVISQQEVSTASSTAAPSSSTTEETETSDVPFTEQAAEFVAKLQQVGTLLSSLKSDFKALEKKWNKEVKSLTKNGKKRKRTGNRAPSGFVKPTRISNELAGFLEKPEGTEMARTAVTRDINNYIRAHNLQDKDNGRKINPDVKLASLLKLSATDELTYFNLQRFMSVHFAKTVKSEAPIAAPVAGVTF